jgi:nucleoside-diphosphate-sugar epimerase
MIIGGRGQTGRAIAARLVADGWQVTATTSSDVDGELAGFDVRWIRHDGMVDLETIVDADVDVIVHTKAYDVVDAEQRIELGHRVGSVIVFSSLPVYSEEGSLARRGERRGKFPGVAGAHP